MSIAGHLQTAQPSSRVAHPEEWFSIIISVLGTALAVAVIWGAPSYEPASGPGWTVPVWLALFYLLAQIICLLFSAAQIRVLGLVDSVLAILPVIAGLVTGIEWLMGHLHLSGFQSMSLLALLIAGSSEFLLTLWIRFVLNRRTVAIDPSNGT
jgi:uncharacterized membrane protein